MFKVNVLMSSYNCNEYIVEQIDSLLAQKDIDVHIVIRDDGSTNEISKKILCKYENNDKITIVRGENLGCGKSFWELVRITEIADFYAFCDQDDVWDDDKLISAIKILQKIPDNIPLLYCGNVRVVDKDLKIISDINKSEKNISFLYTLVKSVSPGCTFVFNNKARELFMNYNGFVDIHDWLACKIVSCFGKVIYDSNPHMSYRQHDNNVIGAEKRGVKAFVKKCKRFMYGKNTNIRSKIAQELKNVYFNEMSDDNKYYIDLLCAYKTDKTKKKQLKIEAKKIFDKKYSILFNYLVNKGKI